MVHKANVLKKTDGLFRSVCLEVAGHYSDLRVDEMLVETAAMWLAKDPSRFDVLVTTNLFGDILSDLAAGKAGGLGLAPSANIGAGAVAGASGGTSPSSSPSARLGARYRREGDRQSTGSAAKLGHALAAPGPGCSAARRLDAAIERVLLYGPFPANLGGQATTQQVADAVLRAAQTPD